MAGTRLQWRSLWLALLTAIAHFTIHTLAFDTYQFVLGQNATINFSTQLRTPYFVCELSTTESENPFYTNNQIDPTALKPEQADRFFVNIDITEGTNFTIQLIINNIEEIDSGWYVLTILEINAQRHIFDAVIRVVRPPGKANCSVWYSTRSLKLKEVHCQASVGSECGGLIMCYQNGKKVSLITPISRTDTLITGAFGMDLQRQVARIKCCSFVANHQKDSDSCNDFEYPVLIPGSPKPGLNGDHAHNMFPLHVSEVISTKRPTDAHPICSENNDWSVNKLCIVLSAICAIFMSTTVVSITCRCFKRSGRAVEETNGVGEDQPTENQPLNQTFPNGHYQINNGGDVYLNHIPTCNFHIPI